MWQGSLKNLWDVRSREAVIGSRHGAPKTGSNRFPTLAATGHASTPGYTDPECPVLGRMVDLRVARGSACEGSDSSARGYRDDRRALLDPRRPAERKPPSTGITMPETKDAASENR